MLEPAPYFYLALSLFFHMGLVLPLLSGWLYSNTKVKQPPPPISVRMAERPAPLPLPAAPPRPRLCNSGSYAPVRKAAAPAPPPARRQAVTAANGRPVAAASNIGEGNYPTYPQAGSGGGGQAGKPGLPEGPGVPSGDGPADSLPILQVAHVTGLPRTIAVPGFLQKQEAPNFSITFQVAVAADGSPRASVVRGSGCTGLDQMLTAELNQMRWEPALRDGKPFDSSFQITVSGDFRRGCESFTLSQNGPPAPI